MKNRILIAVVLLAAATVAAVFWWSGRDVRRRRSLSHCISNMRQTDAAKEQYAIAHSLTNGSVVTRQRIAEYIKGGWQHFDCYSAGGDKYIIGRIGEDPQCPVHGSTSDVHFPNGSKP
jgi:hypothetical protein